MLTNDALDIFNFAVRAANPYENTKKALSGRSFKGRVYVFAIGKAASPMAQAALDILGDSLTKGLLVTKYGHTGSFYSEKFEIIEASHPVSDKNSVAAAEKALSMTEKLEADDTCLVLLSGGGSSLFEKPLVSEEKQRFISDSLMKQGADIFELNTVRKRLSAVKGGSFAAHCSPAKVITLALSDVPGNRRDVIASGITVNDTVTDAAFLAVLKKYSLESDSEILRAAEIKESLPKVRDGEYIIIGDSEILCRGACDRARELGYEAVFAGLLSGDADEAGKHIAKETKSAAETAKKKTALIYGGETTVTVRGNGRGGRSQQLALSAATELKGTENILLLAAGSDGTDGPTDAAGGFVDGNTVQTLARLGISAEKELADNNAYFALGAAENLIITGATGTNVNDLVCVLIDI